MHRRKGFNFALLFAFATATFMIAAPLTHAQQSSSGPTIEQTMAWLSENIKQNVGFGWRETDTSYWGSSPAVTNDWMKVTDTIDKVEPCHLYWTAAAVGKDGPYNSPTQNEADFSRFTINSVKAVPFDILNTVYGGGNSYSKQTGNLTLHIDVFPYSPTYWRLAGMSPLINTSTGTTFDLEYDQNLGGFFYDALVFSDQTMAQRVALATNHAIELCGGKQPTPAKPDLFQLPPN
jgi:hypothetical protein